MNISSIDIEALQIPFNVVFKHAAASRARTQSILVTASTRDHVGYGEGCPREYVTRESVATAIDFFHANSASFVGLSGLDAIRSWTAEHRDRIDENPAAWCAVELALLDLLGKEERKAVEALLSLPRLEGSFHYTAILGAGPIELFSAQLDRYLQAGFADFKVKLSGNRPADRQRTALLREKPVRIRFDANNRWHDIDEACAYLEALDCPFSALEEPVAPGNYDGMRRIAERLGTRIILDESFVQSHQFASIEDDPQRWIINLRISKMGGLIRALEIAEMARERGVPIVIGAQVGETSLLTRAALTVANAFRDILLAQEGAFGTLLLDHDITGRPLMFGKRGVLETATSGITLDCGLGLEIHDGRG